jgi:hypothetical protein
VKYDEKHLIGEKVLSCSFYLYRFRKYVSYGFPIINFCNPAVHYETPCIGSYRYGLKNQASAWPLTLFGNFVLMELIGMFIPRRGVQVCSLQVKSEGNCMQLRRGTVPVSKSITFALLEPTVGCLCE